MSSEFMDAFGAGVIGRETVNVDSPMVDILSELVRVAGTGKGAAAMLGVSPTTFYRWRNAAESKERGISQQPKVSRKAMVAAIRRGSLGPATEKRIRSGAIKLKINGAVKVSKDSRNRTVDVGKYITQRKMGNILTSWLNADDDRAERLLMQGIETHYAEGLEFDSINWMEFGSE